MVGAGWYLGVALAAFAVGSVGLIVRRDARLRLVAVVVMAGSALVTLAVVGHALRDIAGNVAIMAGLVVFIALSGVTLAGAHALRRQSDRRASAELDGPR